MSDTYLWTTHDLSLNGVDRLSGERQERPAIVPVVPIPVIPSKGSPQFLLTGQNVIDFAGIRIPREYWAAATESKVVIFVSWQRRVRNQGEKNGSGVAELPGGNNV